MATIVNGDAERPSKRRRLHEALTTLFTDGGGESQEDEACFGMVSSSILPVTWTIMYYLSSCVDESVGL
jgi:hypothetical protein